MLKINLEKELISQNKKLITPAELLLVNEYDKHAPLEQDNTLRRLGLADNLTTGKNIKDKKQSLKDETTKFDQQRVFHITQIQNLCEKYYLRFLTTSLYKGSIDEGLSLKISTFETAHQTYCTPKNTFIVAPKESFKLRTIPKDPLFFYQINDDYFYLIHKWGNDLSIGNRIKAIMSNGWIQLFTVIVASLLITKVIGLTIFPPVLAEYYACSVVAFLVLVFFSFMTVEIFPISNEWNSDIKD